MVNLQTVAKILTARLAQPTSLVLDSKTLGQLGPAGRRLACQHGWIVESEGLMAISDRADAQAAIRAEAAKQPVAETAEPARPARDMFLSHSARDHGDLPATTTPTDTGKLTIPAWEPFDLHARKLAEQAEYAVGDQVMVSDDGQVYAAVVKAKTSGGYELSFAGDRKPKSIKPSYAPNEIGSPKSTKTATGAAVPAKPPAATRAVQHIYGVGQ